MAFASRIEEVIIYMKMWNIETEVFVSGEELLDFYNEESRSQIYFLDVEMPGIDGIETALRIRERDSSALIVFMTQYHEHVYSVFEARPFRFIRKPFTDEDIIRTINECISYIEGSQQYYFYRTKRAQDQVLYREILYFEGRGHKICIHCRSRDHECYGKISEVASSVNPDIFCRIHVSFVVNMDAIRAVSDTEVVLEGGICLPVSKSYRKNIKTKHLDYMIRKNGGSMNGFNT